VSIFGKTVGGEHPDYANAIESLALSAAARRDFATAEPLLDRALEIRKAVFGPEHRDVATSLDSLAALKSA
jgi:Tetratricopeptide repeat